MSAAITGTVQGQFVQIRAGKLLKGFGAAKQGSGFQTEINCEVAIPLYFSVVSAAMTIITNEYPGNLK